MQTLFPAQWRRCDKICAFDLAILREKRNNIAFIAFAKIVTRYSLFTVWHLAVLVRSLQEDFFQRVFSLGEWRE